MGLEKVGKVCNVGYSDTRIISISKRLFYVAEQEGIIAGRTGKKNKLFSRLDTSL